MREVVRIGETQHQLLFVLEVGNGIGFKKPEEPVHSVAICLRLACLQKAVDLLEEKLVLDIDFQHAD